MHLVFSDFRKGSAKVRLDSPEDAWYLARIITTGDTIEGKTMRKVAVSETATERRPVRLGISVEKMELGDGLRASGKIVSGPDDVPLGSYHSFQLAPGDALTIIKQDWLGYARELLTEACKPRRKPVLVCAFDKGKASFAMLTGAQVAHLADFASGVSGKQFDTGEKGNRTTGFFEGLAAHLSALASRQDPAKIVLASPGFWKEELKRHLTPDIDGLALYATCQGAGKEGIEEVLKRPEVAAALAGERAASESAAVERLLVAIAKNIAAYGMKEVGDAVDAGAVEELLVSERLLNDDAVRELMRKADSQRGSVHIITGDMTGMAAGGAAGAGSSGARDGAGGGASDSLASPTASSDAAKKLDGLGGIGAVLRYSLG
ncbi:hypothetical protein COY28_00410 [Candidatus Woesearchaeota archaeon CG_4_10_14_0_2_um_filter_57_5]|nr:MAG: hypothetical protein AUJ68_05655 [Candidatus Woesearchaeota archaeon CG1_02_57_44]PIN70981.1 MAG: hypothetical protein COV94_00230 [Candidatus Woesearchaeota archaeon CG11_big_fil_rev_8_21_14_0_20_57_5]PIZ57031.1 MAG: hypothetical protein COY28_00410 [Candidatus Woesearchaeota archaeon CG_4_10_14_0_2_um_filter_57_5]